MAADGIGSAFTNKVIASIGNLLTGRSHPFGADGLEIRAVFNTRTRNAFDGPHQIGRNAGNHYAHGDPSSLN